MYFSLSFLVTFSSFTETYLSYGFIQVTRQRQNMSSLASRGYKLVSYFNCENIDVELLDLK